jgi:hypothetical protein
MRQIRPSHEEKDLIIQDLSDYLGSGQFYTQAFIDLCKRVNPDLSDLNLIKDAEVWLRESRKYRDNL